MIANPISHIDCLDLVREGVPNDLSIMISAYRMIPDAPNMAGQPLTVADFTTNIPVCDGMACKRAHYLPRSPRDNRVRNRIIDHVMSGQRERLVRKFSNILYNTFLVRSSQRNGTVGLMREWWLIHEGRDA